MKRLLILFGLTNILWGLILLYPLYVGSNSFNYDAEHIALLLTILVFEVTGIGLLLKVKLAWSFNFLIGLLAVFSMLISSIQKTVETTDYRVSLEIYQIILIVVVYILTSLTFFSLIRTFKGDILDLLKVGVGQKRITLTLGILLSTCLVIFLAVR
jgi:hypothetical protein